MVELPDELLFDELAGQTAIGKLDACLAFLEKGSGELPPREDVAFACEVLALLAGGELGRKGCQIADLLWHPAEISYAKISPLLRNFRDAIGSAIEAVRVSRRATVTGECVWKISPPQ